MMTWQVMGKVTMQVVGMGQWFPTMWPSHGLPHGNEKMPNEGLKSDFQK
jgi:hypothetical protein